MLLRKAKSEVTVELIFLGEFTSPYNPLIGAVSSEDEALKLSKAHPSLNLTWETCEVSDTSKPLCQGEPLWVLIQGGIFADIAHTNPSPVAVFSTLQEAHAEREKRKKCFGEDLLLWKISLGAIVLSAPDWSVDIP